MKIIPKYSPLDKVELISGSQWWVNSITIYVGYYTYHLWNGENTYIYVDEEQIAKVVLQKNKAGFSIKLKSPK